MATNQTHSSADPLTPLLEKFRANAALALEGAAAASLAGRLLALDGTKRIAEVLAPATGGVAARLDFN